MFIPCTEFVNKGVKILWYDSIKSIIEELI